jgi:hypothetical protein
VPDTWTQALNAYDYPVDLADYDHGTDFPGFFMRTISGDRTSTIAFEDYFREHSNLAVEPYFEVVFWKLYRMKLARIQATKRIVDYVTKHDVSAAELYCAVTSFVESPTIPWLSVIRAFLGIKSQVLAVALTFPAFADPERFPMIDRQTAKWVTLNLEAHNQGRGRALTVFSTADMGLRYDDFDSYLNWVGWCNETADLLKSRTDLNWRARDVEMAVFTAARKKLLLNPLH